jgi:hypothetical protein
VAAFDFELTRVMGIFVAIRVPTPEPLLEASMHRRRNPLSPQDRSNDDLHGGFLSSVS